jgi:hypothetical protein
MAARILSTLVFWTLMSVLITGAALVVVGVYIPLVFAKALFYAVTGRLREVTGVGEGDQDETDVVRPHIG